MTVLKYVEKKPKCIYRNVNNVILLDFKVVEGVESPLCINVGVTFRTLQESQLIHMV